MVQLLGFYMRSLRLNFVKFVKNLLKKNVK